MSVRLYMNSRFAGNQNTEQSARDSVARIIRTNIATAEIRDSGDGRELDTAEITVTVKWKSEQEES